MKSSCNFNCFCQVLFPGSTLGGLQSHKHKRIQLHDTGLCGCAWFFMIIHYHSENHLGNVD